MRVYQTGERPDPRIRGEFVERIDAVLEQIVTRQAGRTLFVTGQKGSGRSATLAAIATRLRKHAARPVVLYADFGDNNFHKRDNSLSRTVITLVGQILPLTAVASDPITATIANIAGQLLQASASAQAIAENFARQGNTGDLDVIVIQRMIQRAARDRPVALLVDHYDEAPGIWWDLFLARMGPETETMPLLQVVAIDGPAELPKPGTEPTGPGNLPYRGVGLAQKLCHEQGVGEWHYLPPLTIEQVQTWMGRAEPELSRRLYEASGGNAAWLRLLWNDWWEQRVLEADTETLTWRLTETAGVVDLGSVNQVLDRRIAGLVGEDVHEIERTRQILAVAALEGRVFTPAALAQVFQWDGDDLYDWLDDTLLQEEDRLEGMVREREPVTLLPSSEGQKHTLYRYEIVSELVYFTLVQKGLSTKERTQYSLQMAKALMAAYGLESSRISATLARLLAEGGDREQAYHYRTMHASTSNRAVLRAQALDLVAWLNTQGEDWDVVDARQALDTLERAGNAMIDHYPWAETQKVWEAAHAVATTIPLLSAVARTWYGMGRVVFARGDYDAALKKYGAALDIFRELGDRRSEAAVLYVMGKVNHVRGAYDAALEKYGAALDIFRELGDQQGEAAVLYAMGRVVNARGAYDAALKKYGAALQLFRELGDRRGEATVQHAMGEMDTVRGDYDAALEKFGASLDVNRELGDRRGEAAVLRAMGPVDTVRGDYDAALEKCGAALDIFRELGDRQGEAGTLRAMGRVFRNRDEYEKAREMYRMALQLFEALGLPEAETVRADLAQLDEDVA